MITRLYELLERRNQATVYTVSNALDRLIEAQAERVELQVFRIASQIIMSEPLPAPREWDCCVFHSTGGSGRKSCGGDWGGTIAGAI